MSVLAGRGYGPDDRIGPRRGGVVNETAALRFWGDAGSAVGGRIRPQGSPDAWIPVLGVVSDVTIGSLGSPPGPMIYYAMPEQGTDGPDRR